MLRAPLRIEPGHPALAGHFPGRPLVPAVLLLDALAALLQREGLVLAVVESAKFLQPLPSGRDAWLELTAGQDGRWTFRIHAADAGTVACGRVRARPQ